MTNDPYAERREVNRLAASVWKIPKRKDRIEALAEIPEQYREQVKAAVIKMMGK